MAGILYVVATPLGNLEDLSPRAARILKEAGLVACEDTRHTRRLLEHVGSGAPTISYHEHNEAVRSQELIKRLKEGDTIALVSDAGTPLLSDPGYQLVSECRAESIPVIPVPGPSAVAAALSVAGLPTDRFLFVGFPPKRPGPRRTHFQELATVAATLVFYVSPHDLLPTLRDLLEVLGNRRAFLTREMTKLYETSSFGPLQEVLQEVEQQVPRGEYTLVVEGRATEAGPPLEAVDVLAYVHGLMETRGLSSKDAVRKAAEDLNRSRRDVYHIFNHRDDSEAAPERELE